jgi:hypothetical protein
MIGTISAFTRRAGKTKMASLLERLRGQESDPEMPPEIPDNVPPEWERDLEQDPPPGAKAARVKLRPAGTSGAVTPALKKRIKAELEAYVEFVALPIMLRDETCGGVLHEQAAPIADAIANILSRYPDLAHKFLATGMLGDWIKLGVVLQPVLKTMWGHHFTRSAEEQEETGGERDLAAFPVYRPGT